MEELLARIDRIERLALLSAKRVLTVEDAALLLGKSTKTIYNLLDEIPHYKNGHGIFFKRDEFEAWQCRIECKPIKQII